MADFPRTPGDERSHFEIVEEVLALTLNLVTKGRNATPDDVDKAHNRYLELEHFLDPSTPEGSRAAEDYESIHAMLTRQHDIDRYR
ncbi:hypothetical protein GOV09_04590 [Candidatus Woesearchaeota archaeon]|nr:hypothetical protein [Candidatus Woesearchaeota archaeon]